MLGGVAAGQRRGRWTPLVSALAFCLMAWSSGPTLLDRFAEAMGTLGRAAGRRRLGRSYNGLLGALIRQWGGASGPLRAELRRRAMEMMGAAHQAGEWLVLAVDGTKVALPRTGDNLGRFGVADNGVGPQAFVTAIVHALTGLVWSWRIGPARSSERAHLADMVADLPRGALLLMDGYYVGQELWTALIGHGVHFLMRAGGNLRLIQGLIPGRSRVDERAGIVYVWRNGHAADEPPMRLRLITVGSRGQRLYLLTTVLESTRLSRRLAGSLYRMRWGVELFYRSIKQTLDRAKLSSRAPLRVEVELNWTMVAAALLALLATAALRSRGLDLSRWSFAGAWRVVRHAMRSGPRTGGARHRHSLDAHLARAVKDRYPRERPKASRHNPRTCNTPALTKPPRVITAPARLQQLAASANPIQLLR